MRGKGREQWLYVITSSAVFGLASGVYKWTWAEHWAAWVFVALVFTAGYRSAQAPR